MPSYTVVVEQDEEGWFLATVPSLPGCHTQGKTLEEARDRIREAIAAFIGNGASKQTKFVALERIAV